jgi:cytochrome c
MMVPIHQILSRHLSRHDRRRQTRAFWVRNLRFVTDSTKDDLKGAPPIMPAGMRGDRASVIFAASGEINKVFAARC